MKQYNINSNEKRGRGLPQLFLIFLAPVFLPPLVFPGCGGEKSVSEDASITDGAVSPDRECSDTCDVAGESFCDESGKSIHVCVYDEQGCLEMVHEPCDQGEICRDGECISCPGETGIFREQTIDVDGEERYYFLYVPETYDCENPWPALVDLHGTAGPPRPEEAYGLQGAINTADHEGFILVRPRSRFSSEGGWDIYRWDQNPGDPERNRVFINELIVSLQREYFLDQDRLYVMGFSSGTNQTTTAQSDEESPFSGYGHIGGGSWQVSSLADNTSRVYLNTGYRDYMRIYHDELLVQLDEAGVSPSLILSRESHQGHELYDWMFPELFAFLDRGERPPEGSLNPQWRLDQHTGTDEDLLALYHLDSGDVLAVGAGETVLKRNTVEESWSPIAVQGNSAFPGRAWTSVCITEDGFGIMAGGGQAALSDDDGETWHHRSAIPELGGINFGYSYINAVGCSDDTMAGIGYWVGLSSTDGGTTWQDVHFDAGGYRAQGSTIRFADWGTWMAAGYYNYLARSEDGSVFNRVSPWDGAHWYYDVAPSGEDVWMAVAEHGRIFRSTDDGLTFQEVFSGEQWQDLYSVSFRDSDTGLAVGLFGSALLTTDEGATWEDRSAGLNIFLGSVSWLDDGTALVVGEGGTALIFDPPD